MAWWIAWPKIDTSMPPELETIGEYCGAVASALAFVWLVAGFYLQREELTLQRQQLGRQADETRTLQRLLTQR